MAGSNALLSSYLSPLAPDQEPPTGYASRGFSFETALGSAAPSLCSNMAPRPGGYSAGYQAPHASAPLRHAAPSSQGPFQFSASGPFNFTAGPVRTPLEIVEEGAAATTGMPMSMPPQTLHAASRGSPMPLVPEARAQSLPVGAQVVDRSTYRASLCEHAFLFVDALKIRKLNMSQNKTALTMVFQQLGDVKMPRDDWYVQVFRNFDSGDCGLIDANACMDIMVQWDDHQLERKRKQREKEQKDKPQLPQPPPQPAAEVKPAPLPQPPPPPLPPQSAKPLPQPPPAPIAVGAEASSATPCGMTSDGEATPKAEETPKTTKNRLGAAELKTDIMFPTYVGRLAIFDDYEFHGDAGKGAFGKVMVVRSKNTKQLRACKVMAGQTAMQRELIDTEINLLKAMNHPNIVKLYEVYFEEAPENKVTSGNIYLIFELCEGGDLFGRILHHYERLHQPMTEGHVAYMMSQILSAVAYLHDAGIVHRDMKPENIMFTDRSSSSAIKIIDYGLADFTAKIRDKAREVKIEKTGLTGKLARMLPTVNGKHILPQHERKKVMVRAGTPHYMAPEMLEHQWYDQKADVFSIGIILSQLLTGWHPFYTPQVDDEVSVRKRIADPAPVEFPNLIFSKLSAEANDLCQKLLEKDPEKRPSSKQALEHIWFQDPSKPSPYGDKGGLSMSIFEGLMKYQAYNKLKRAVLQLLTRELSEYQIQELRKKFNALDSKGDGLLSPEELIAGMRHIGYDMKEEELAKVMAALDGTGNNMIGYKEFISALIERRVKFDRAQLEECFKKFDTNNTGRIAYEDVAKMLQSGAGGAAGITQSEWVEIAAPGNTSASADQRVELTLEQFILLMEAEE